MNKWLLMIMLLLVTAACSDQEPPEKTVWDEQLKTMDKAREVEQQILDSAERQRREIEAKTD
ncbi:hypothetical protein [Methylophaga sp. OBS4]|uniref:hypothetical protein n=1 Tax=Methylophaga sp. OBS4 TaxID=2991935 RepID=UPI0022523F42|nr:hypothetical protein [Methylophaga sp. OBS4]MCX4187256.1 hypothetical protein [Methylophaga sp. OBS4]